MAKVQTVVIPLTIAQVSTAIVSASQEVPSGRLIGVASKAGAMDGSDTYTVSITDKNGISIYSVASKAESSTDVDFSSTYGVTEATPLSIPCVGPLTVTVTASAQQDDAAVDYTIYLYIEN